jgi:penicillin-binding protein 1C
LGGAGSAGCEALGAQAARAFGRTDAAFASAQPRGQGAPHAARALLARLKPAAGSRVATTLDAGFQAAAVRALHTRLSELSGRNVEDGAVIVLDNASGEVLAWVGSSGDLSQAAQVDGANALRQAGSTLKPFLYGLALERRVITAASVLEDAPLQVRTDTGLYVPRNYASRHRGPVSARAALAGSLNVPAVRLLGLTGPDHFVGALRAAGLATVHEDADHYGPSLALGSADVTLTQLTNAYRMRANAGLWSPVRFGLPEPPVAPRRVMDAQAAWVVGDILADRAARAVAFGLANPLETPFWSAVKTGTSKDMRDNWAVGFSSRYTVGVWVGNAGGAPMHDVSGVTGAAPVWRDLMLRLHRGAVPPPPPRPAGVEVRRVRFEPAIEAPREEVFLAGSAAEVIRLADGAALAPRIMAPLAGSVLALDPDIPPAQQQLSVSAQAPPGARLELDGKTLGSAARRHAWFPQPGTHLLTLRAADGEVLDTVRFEVRGLRGVRAAGPLRTAAR